MNGLEVNRLIFGPVQFMFQIHLKEMHPREQVISPFNLFDLGRFAPEYGIHQYTIGGIYSQN